MNLTALCARALLVAVCAVLADPVPARGAELAVRDSRAREIRLARPAARIISLAPHITELLFAAGAGAKIVGAIAYSDFPPAARAIARIGDTHAIDAERILGLAPDLIVAWDKGNSPIQLAALERLGIPIYFDGASRLDQIAQSIERLGRLAGTDAFAQDAAARFRARLALLRARYADRPKLRVFHQVWDAPLMTINGEHLLSDVIRLCGGVNVFADAPALVPRIPPEAVLLADPDLITTAAAPDQNDPLALWRRWPGLRAVAQHHLFALPADLLSRLSPRVLDGAQAMCDAIERARD